MADLNLTPEDEAEIRDILLNWRAAGVENPVLPADVDIDGDGVEDGYGLDENDQVIIVSGVPLDETVFRSDGDGLVESGAIVTEDG